MKNEMYRKIFKKLHIISHSDIKNFKQITLIVEFSVQSFDIQVINSIYGIDTKKSAKCQLYYEL